MLNPLRDPLKGNAVVPQKYIDTLMRQGWVKVVRCKDCKNWERDWTPRGTHGERHWCGPYDGYPDANFFCADGELDGARKDGGD